MNLLYNEKNRQKNPDVLIQAIVISDFFQTTDKLII